MEFLQQQGQGENAEPAIYSLLSWEEAEQGDESAIAKVLVALLYELRLLHTGKFEQLACTLPPEVNYQIAIIIKHMDEREENWASVLGCSKGSTAGEQKFTPLAPRNHQSLITGRNKSLSQSCFSTPQAPQLPPPGQAARTEGVVG